MPIENMPVQGKTLFRRLIFWFLLLSLLPVSVASWLNYQQAKNSLIVAAEDKLYQDSELNYKFINNWFDYRLMDIKNQASAQVNMQLLKQLSIGLSESEKTLSEYVKSKDYSEITTKLGGDLVNMREHYDYIYDLFLIDKQGNILFSVMNANGKGENLKSSSLVNTQFSKSVFKSLQTGTVEFSDLQHYGRKESRLSAFLSAPIIDNEGKTVAVFAMQLQLDRIFDLMKVHDHNSSSLTHYLLSSEGVLRSPVLGDLKTVLTKHVDPFQEKSWMLNHIKNQIDKPHVEQVFEYFGAPGKKVFGIHQLVKIQNVTWILVSEIDSSEIFSSSLSMAKTALLILTLSVLLIVFVAVYQVKRITTPIKKLVKASLNVAQGKTDQQVDIQTDNEIGQLAFAFNEMLNKWQRSEASAKKSNANLKRALSELSSQQYALDQHAIVSITDLDGCITFVNDNFCETSGYTHDQLIGHDHRILNANFHPDSFFKLMYQTIQNGKIWHAEVCNKNKNGEMYWLDTTIAPFKDEHGVTQSYISIRTNISEQKEAQLQQANRLKMTAIKLDISKALASQSDLSSSLSQALHYTFSLPDFHLNEKACIYLFDQNLLEFKLFLSIGEFVDENSFPFKAILNLCKDAILSKQITVRNGCGSSFCNKEGLHGHYILPLLNNRNEKNTEKDSFVGLLFLCSDQNIQMNDQKLSLLHEVSSIFANALIREEANSWLKQATETAQQNNQLKGEFLASMSHEIRTPMNGVLGMLGLLLNSKLNEDQRHKASLAKSSAESLLGLINDILDFSKVEAGKMELELIDFNLRVMFGELSEAMAMQAYPKGIEIILDLTKVEHSMVKGDPGRLRQVVTNLVSNSIKFTEQGEIKISVSITNADKNNLNFICSVEDSGIGIPTNKIPLLFDVFTQVDASTTRKYGGTGLGLAICQKLSELMGGTISVSSELNKGSVFTFSAKLQVSQQSQKVFPQVDVSKLQLLIVDDNSTNLEVLRGQLEHWGANVTEANSGKKALQLCKERLVNKRPLFDVAFLDMQMPGMDGAELGKKIRNEPLFDKMKLVMMTSIASQNEAQFFADLGFNAYFPKPATTSDLFDALNVVADDGVVLQQAFPLVTHDYLTTLIHKSPQAENVLLNRSQIKILLVEDNKVNQLVALGILDELGFTADVAENGAQALAILKASVDGECYQLLYMDCQMPVIDGYEATKAIRNGDAGEYYKTVPIIAMTANAMQGDREKCLDSGMNDYLGKPIDPILLQEKLLYWLKADLKIEEPVVCKTTCVESLVLKQSTEKQALLCWNKEDALLRLLNKESLLETLIVTFLNEIPVKIKALQLAVSNGDDPQISALAHNIKGASANLSAEALAFYAFELEKNSKSENSALYAENFELLHQAYNELLKLFQSYLQDTEHRNENSSAQKLTKQSVLDRLIKLSKRLQQNDYIEADEINVLINSDLPATIKNKLVDLQRWITLFDLSNANDLVQQLITELQGE